MNRDKIFLFIFLVLFSICVGVWYEVLNRKNQNNLSVSFLDVGQGDAIYIKAPNGVDVLIDAGDGKDILSQLRNTMSFFDKKIDMIVATNPDKDHIGGFVSVFKRFKVDKVLVPGTKNSTRTYEDFLRYENEEGSQNIIVRRGMDFMLDEKRNIYLSILFPDRDVSLESPNDGSIVAKLVFGKTCILLQGDAPKEVERHILSLEKENNLSCQVVKAGHHGSRTSSDFSYIKAIAPDFLIVSAGENNRYGHPHKEVLETMEKVGVTVLRTDVLGKITFVSNGEVWHEK